MNELGLKPGAIKQKKSLGNRYILPDRTNSTCVTWSIEEDGRVLTSFDSPLNLEGIPSP